MSAYPLARRMRRLHSSVVRDLLRHVGRDGMLSLAGGLPAAELFDTEGLRAATAHALRDTASLQYGETQGSAALRARLATLMGARGLPASADDIVVTNGSQQALDLLARCLLDPGDTVAVESPTYLAALQVFDLCEARYLLLPGDSDGARLSALLASPAERLPKLVYLVPTFANPTGASLSLARRLELLRWAAARQVFVLEDDPYGELRDRGETLPALAVLAREVAGAGAWVGYASTLSKTVAPGLRIGWAVLPPALVEATTRVKQALDLHTSSFTQAVAEHYLASDRLSAHLARLRVEYAARRDALASALAAAFGPRLHVHEPDGGMFLWARFSDGTDSSALLEAALAEGVAFVPGHAFHVEGGDPSTLRLNFTTLDAGKLREAVGRLLRAHAHLQSTPIRPAAARA